MAPQNAEQNVLKSVKGSEIKLFSSKWKPKEERGSNKIGLKIM